MKAWTVRLGNFAPFKVPHLDRPIKSDTVFTDSDMTAEQVKQGLVEHDGYPPSIKVYCAPGKARP